MLIALFSMIEMLSIVMCLFYFYHKQFRLDFKTIIYLLSDMVYMTIVNRYGLPEIYTMIFYFVFVIYIGIEFGFKLSNIMINGTLSILLVTVLQVCGAAILNLFFSENSVNELTYLLINIIIFVIILFGLKHLKIYKILEFLQEKLWLVFGVIIYACIVLFFYLTRYKAASGMYIGGYLLQMLSIGCICFLTAFLVKYRMSLTDKTMEMKFQNTYMETYRELIKELQSKQHDFDNHINTIFSLQYVCKTYDELVQAQKNYMNELQVNNRFNKVLTMGNPVLVGFLYSKFIEYDNHGIDISYNLDFKQLECGIPIFRIIEITGNILNNAEEAVRNREEKKIHVQIVEDERSILIEIRNIGDKIEIQEMANFFRKGYSSKGLNRGIGLYNVKKLCDKYEVDISCCNRNILEENWIVFQLMIKKFVLHN